MRHFRRLWDEQQTLYTADDEEEMKEDIRSAIEKEGIGYEREPPPRLPVVTAVGWQDQKRDPAIVPERTEEELKQELEEQKQKLKREESDRVYELFKVFGYTREDYERANKRFQESVAKMGLKRE